jgi:hypothetical protein
MSKHINVNPGQYKVGGRERPGQDIVAEEHKQNYSQSRSKAAKLTPGKSGPELTAGPQPSRSVRGVSGGVKTRSRASSQADVSAGRGQASQKEGKKSSAQKRASARHNVRSMPAAKPVAGASGRATRLTQRRGSATAGKRRPTSDNLDKANE